MNARRNGISRRPARVAAVGALVLVVGLATGPGSQAEEAPEPVELAYDCPLPPSESADATPTRTTTRVTAQVETRLPGTALVGKPIVPGPVTLTADLPYDDIAGLLPEGTQALSSRATLAVGVRQGGESADMNWSNLTAQGGVPAAGQELSLKHSGEVASVTAGSAGDLTLNAGQLDLEISTSAADGAPGPQPLSLACTLAEGQDALLATVTVTGEDGTTNPGSPGPDESTGGAGDGKGLAVDPGRKEAADLPETCPDVSLEGKPDITYAPSPPVPEEELNHGGATVPNYVCAFAIGFGSVRKLDGSMVINDPSKQPALMNVSINVATASEKSRPSRYSRFGSIGAIDLPDAESTFLAFGFTPVTAKVKFETGPISIFTGNNGVPPLNPYGVIGFEQSLRLYDVRVNGTPLDVGPGCRTAKPYKVKLQGAISEDGTSGSYTNVLIGGLLTGSVSIPEFTGCGTAGGEDLDALFTASISGSDNYIAMNQATVCIPRNGRGCPPVMPKLPDFQLPTN